jgi:hypothetical protein
MRYSGLLLLVAFVGVLIRFAVWIGLALAIAVLLVVLWKLVGWLDRRLDSWDSRRRDRAAARAAVAARADEQNRLFLAGDERGTYGDYPPAV